MRSARRARRPGRAATFAAFAAALALAASCGAHPPMSEAQRTARAQALIDSGNQAYTQGDYRLAVRRYAAAAVERKDDPAAYYGMGMALSKLGRDEEARTAYARARSLTQSPASPHRGTSAHP